MGSWAGLDRVKLGTEDRTGRIGWVWYLEPNHELAPGVVREEERRVSEFARSGAFAEGLQGELHSESTSGTTVLTNNDSSGLLRWLCLVGQGQLLRGSLMLLVFGSVLSCCSSPPPLSVGSLWALLPGDLMLWNIFLLYS